MTESMTDIEALQLISRFAITPNILRFCGKDSAPSKLAECITSGKCEGIEEEVAHFNALYPYLKTIAQITGKPVFSYEVAEGYWLGNNLLKKAKPEDYDLLLKYFQEQSIPNFQLEKMRENRPKLFIPFHLTRVLDGFPQDLDSVNNCMIKWGSVYKIKENTAYVKLCSLTNNNKTYQLVSDIKVKPLEFDPKFVPGLKISDTVAVHWNKVAKVITEEEVRNLTYWTNQVLTSLS